MSQQISLFDHNLTKDNSPREILLNDDGSSAGGDHKHRSALSHGFVIEIDADHGISAQGSSLLLHLCQSCVFGFAKHLFV